MKRYFWSITPAIVTCFLYLIYPHTAHASTGQANEITLLQLLVLALVMGWYIYNHFKDEIKAFFKGSSSSDKEGGNA